MRYLLSIFAFAVALLPIASAGQSGPPVTALKVGLVPVETASELFFAMDMGFFKKQGLEIDLQPMQNGAAVGAALLGGSLDVGLADTVSISSAHARGIPFVYIAPAMLDTYSAPTLAMMVSGSGPIHDAKDFNNKTIGVNGINNITMLPFEAWIDKNGGDSKTVKWVEVPISTAGDAVLAGRIDGTITGEPFVTFDIDKGLRPIYIQKNGMSPRFLLAAYVTTQDWLTKNPAIATKFIAALREAGVWARTNREAALSILAKYTKISVPVTQRMRHGEFPDTLQASDLQPVIDVAAQYGVLTKPFPASELIYK